MDIRFSPLENEILKVLGRRKMTITQLVEKLYSKKRMNEEIVMSNAIRRINKKCLIYDLTWELKGEGTGRHGRKVWRESNGFKKKTKRS